MRIYHRTSLNAALSIIASREIRANDREPGSEVIAGPFFFLDGVHEHETATAPHADQVKLDFECSLETIIVKRDTPYSYQLLTGDVSHFTAKLILEESPHVAGRITQARIIPSQKNALTLLGYECQISTWPWDQWRLERAARNRLSISIASSQ